MNKIIYKIEFYDYWHIGSGLSGGSAADALVLKDKNDFPYIPGKTLKGLIREAAVLLNDLKVKDFDKGNWINKMFGETTDDYEDRIKKQKKDSTDEENKRVTGFLYFTNATLTETLQKGISESKTKDFLYDIVASNEIDADTGTTKKHSLREMQVTVPLTLFAEIQEHSDEDLKKLNMCLKMIKRMGQNRNRGLGRCKLEIIDPKIKEENNGN